jgi:hypothetical protein
VSLGELKTSLKLRLYRVLGGCQGVSLISPFGGGWGVGPGAGSKSSGVKKKYYHHWRLLKGEVQFSGMPLPVPLPTVVRPCAQLGSMACVMAMSADATFSGTVLLCPFSLEQPHDIADGMYVQVSAAPLTGCLAVYAV